jgi:hypothetical protein
MTWCCSSAPRTWARASGSTSSRGLTVKRSFPGRYVEFNAPAGGIKLALYPGRAGLVKDADVSPDGDGSHGIAVNSGADRFSDPDGFVWETA